MGQAEEYVSGVTGYGAKFGFGLATIGTSMDVFDDEESFAGGTFGVFLDYGLSPRLSLRPELLFVAKGAGGSFLRGRSWRHDYLEIPILLKYHLSENGRLKPNVYAGPAVAFLLSGEFRSSILSEDRDTGDAMKSTDLSIVFGGAVDYKRFSFDVRYTIGMGNVYDPADWNRLLNARETSDLYHMKSDDYMKNRFLSFTLEYRFSAR
jgi:hypothetical protein